MNKMEYLIERGILAEDGEINIDCITENAFKEGIEFVNMIVEGEMYTISEVIAILECVDKHHSSLYMHGFVQALVMQHLPHMELGFFYDAMECEEAADFYVEIFLETLHLFEEVGKCIQSLMKLRYEAVTGNRESNESNDKNVDNVDHYEEKGEDHE